MTKILIVEDEAIIAMELRNEIELLGYEVIAIVDSGEEAFTAIKKTIPDIILMDITIKGDLNGIGTAQKIKEDYDIPVIFATAYLDELRIKAASIVIPFGYIVKPYSKENVKVTIEMALYIHENDKQRRTSEKLTKLLLDATPHPAMLIQRDRTIILANKIARELGVEVGSKCWKTFGKSLFISDIDKELVEKGIEPPAPMCHFCLADSALELNITENDPEVVTDQTYDTYWVFIEKDLYLHYAIPVKGEKE